MTIEEMLVITDSPIKRHVQSGNIEHFSTLRTIAIQPSVMIGNDNKSDYKIKRDTLENIETSDGINIDWLRPYD